MKELILKTKEFSDKCSALVFDSFDGYVYNPLDYAWDNHREYLEKYVSDSPEALLLGMNPGPFGMTQTGIPFGEINTVRDYLKLNNPVKKPEVEHPNRPVEGLNIKRSEISGLRLWSMIKERFADSKDFTHTFAVMNYCPLCFLSSVDSAKNITPDKLSKQERDTLYRLCNEYLEYVIELLNPRYLIGVGKFAMEKLEQVNKDSTRLVTSIIHPSPGNPQANNGWKEKTVLKLTELGLWN